MNKVRLLVYSLLSGALMSLPWLVDGAGWVSLFALLPLLLAEDMAFNLKIRHFFWYHYGSFVLWNALTTFWVCNATVAGGIFAILANALQMSVIFAVFHFSRRRMKGALPYIFLAAMWIAWERAYFSAQISWPWLVLGNAFARTCPLAQWYEFTGSLGGSLWIWAVNLSLFGVLSSLASGGVRKPKQLVSMICGLVLLVACPIILSLDIYRSYREVSEGSVKVLIGQPNYDSYEKFEYLSQEAQTCGLLAQFDEALGGDTTSCLLLAPETFTDDVVLNDVTKGETFHTFCNYMQAHPGTEILFGASSYKLSYTRHSPSVLARRYGQGWIESYNSALLLRPDRSYDIFHKSKLVVGTELTPYPKVFVPVENWLCKVLGYSSMMGRCQGQKEISLLNYNDSIPLGCAVCYESVYGEYCTGYVNKGARAMTVITNDVWWGDTPGYVQHCNYSRLRAIELRRDIARCANTGISCFINQRGDIVSRTSWWQKDVLEGSVNLSSRKTAFVRYGDITGRCCTLLFLLLATYLFVQILLLHHKRPVAASRQSPCQDRSRMCPPRRNRQK